MARPIAEYPPSGIKVVVVGGGFGGLTTAIECRLKGHSVDVLEKAPEWEHVGDIISIGSNAGQILSRWDSKMVSERLRGICMNIKSFEAYTHSGEFIFEQPAPERSLEKPSYDGHRAEIHRVLFEYAEHLGVNFRMGRRVVRYNEDPPAGKAWAVCDTGETYSGNVVVAADGVRSRSRSLALGVNDKAKPTGYAVYRAWFDAKESGIMDDPLTREFAVNGDSRTAWFGQDVHFIVATCNGGRKISWVCTHKDDGDTDDNLSSPGHLPDVLRLLEGWDPRCRAIVSRTPSLVDWKLVHRDPLPMLVTSGGHICLLGDAAHPFLPTSIQGCAQAMEDGVALATLLSLSRFDACVSPPDKIPTALRAYERLRYERVKAAQEQGEKVRDMWHKADWTRVRRSPDIIKLPRPKWLLEHDCERFVRRMWRRVLEESSGGPRIALASLAANAESGELDVERHLGPGP